MSSGARRRDLRRTRARPRRDRRRARAARSNCTCCSSGTPGNREVQPATTSPGCRDSAPKRPCSRLASMRARIARGGVGDEVGIVRAGACRRARAANSRAQSARSSNTPPWNGSHQRVSRRGFPDQEVAGHADPRHRRHPAGARPRSAAPTSVIGMPRRRSMTASRNEFRGRRSPRCRRGTLHDEQHARARRRRCRPGTRPRVVEAAHHASTSTRRRARCAAMQNAASSRRISASGPRHDAREALGRIHRERPYPAGTLGDPSR